MAESPGRFRDTQTSPLIFPWVTTHRRDSRAVCLLPLSYRKSGRSWTCSTLNDNFYVFKIGYLPEVVIFIVLPPQYLNLCRAVLFES